MAFGVKLLNFSFLCINKLKTKNCTLVRYFTSYCKHNSLRKTPACLNRPNYRCISVSKFLNVNLFATNHGKLFKETENDYAHMVMENISKYSKSLLKHPLSVYPSISDSRQLNGFTNVIDEFIQVTLQNVSEGLLLENSKFTELVEKVIAELPEASDENIIKVLHYLCMWPFATNTTAPNFKKLWNALDHECVKRLNKWDVNEKLLVADYWFHLKLSRISQYNSAVIFSLVKDIDALSNHEVVQLMFYINLQRKIPDLFLSDLEKKLESVVKSLTLEELGIVCLGFFKTQNSISNENLLLSIIKQFTNSIDEVNTVTISAILKFLRKSRNPSLTDSYILTLHKCIPHIPNFDIPTTVHLALLASECNVYHPLLLNCVSEKLIKEMSNVRIKDCAKFLMSLSLHNHFEEKFRDCFFEELKKEERQSEIFNYPVHVLHSALAYAYLGHYNYDLIAKIFTKDFVKRAVMIYPEMHATYAELDYCLEIECPDYAGPRLDIADRNILHSRRGNIPSKSKFQNMQTRLLNDVCQSLTEILEGDKCFHIRHILPHVYSPDIIVRLSGSSDRSVSEFCQKFSPDVILKPPKDEVWAALVVGSIYSFAYRTTHMTGIIAMKLRQLSKLGYHVTFIPYFNVSRNTTQRKIFLREKLNMLDEKVSNSYMLKVK